VGAADAAKLAKRLRDEVEGQVFEHLKARHDVERAVGKRHLRDFSHHVWLKGLVEVHPRDVHTRLMQDMRDNAVTDADFKGLARLESHNLAQLVAVRGKPLGADEARAEINAAVDLWLQDLHKCFLSSPGRLATAGSSTH
jgi:hypothetical protein